MIKKTIASLMLLASTASIYAQAQFDYLDYQGNDNYYAEHPLQSKSSVYNPILPGFYPDPAITTNGKGDYYVATSTFTYFPGVPLFHSRDLKHWRQIGHILSRESQLENMAGQHVSGGIFAPAISYNKKTNTYYMITTNVGAGNFYVKAKANPDGTLDGCEWSDPIHVPSIQGIDPSIFIDDNGKAYIVNNDDAPNAKPEYDGHRTVRIQELDLNTDKCVGKRKIIVNKGVRPEEKPIWCEAPHIYKINGYYYLMTAEGGTSNWHSEVIYRSKSVWGPYKPYEKSPILTQRTLPRDRKDAVTCAGHADLVQTTSGDWYAVFLGVRTVEDAENGYENIGRETYMIPVTWTEDGWPEMTMSTGVVPMQLSVNEKLDDFGGNYMGNGNFSWKENFNDAQLSQEWIGLRLNPSSLYTVSNGWLNLKGSSVKSTEKGQPALLCRRIQHHQFTAETRMKFAPSSPTAKAGIMLFKDEMNQLQLLRVGNAMKLIQISKEGEKVLGEMQVKSDDVQLKIEATGTDFQFLCREKDRAWHTVGIAPAAQLSTKFAGGFTGTVIGLYCEK